MTLEEFVKKYNGKKVDFDGAFGAQCVDLFRQYNKEVWGNPHTGAVEGARNLYLNYKIMPEEIKYLARSQKCMVGDAVVYDATENNKYGHVAIVVGILGDSLLLFEQDGFKQDGAKIGIRDKSNILGYLRKK